MQQYNNAFLGKLVNVEDIKKHYDEMENFKEEDFHLYKLKELNKKLKISRNFLKRLDCFDNFHEALEKGIEKEYLKTKEVENIKKIINKKKSIRKEINEIINSLENLKEAHETSSLEAEEVIETAKRLALQLANYFNATTKLSIYFTKNLSSLLNKMTDQFINEWKEGFETHKKKIPKSVDEKKIRSTSLETQTNRYLNNVDALLSYLPQIMHFEEQGTTPDLRFTVYNKIVKHLNPAS